MSSLFKGYEMEWSVTSNVPPRSESNFSNWLRSFDYDPSAGNSRTHAATQTGPIVSHVPESEKMTNAYQCPNNNNEMVKKKKKALTSEQSASLEQSFREDMKLDLDRKLKLSNELGLQPRQVAVWFQNRRARWKVKHLEESYDLLRQDYDAVWREKQMLHDEVKKLKDIIAINQGLMKTQSNLDSHQINGTGEYMMVASSCWPPPM